MTEISQSDHELIRRYLAGRLTDEEESMLESRSVRDAAFRTELELSAALKQGMRKLDARGEIDGILAGARTAWRRPAIAIAASVAIIAIASLSVLHVVDSPRHGDPTARAVSLYLERTRGVPTGDTVNWTLGAAATRLQLHLDVGATPAPRYRVEIWREASDGSAPLMRLVESTSAEGHVVVAFDDSLLAPGLFEVRLTPHPESFDGEVTRYHLRVSAD